MTYDEDSSMVSYDFITFSFKELEPIFNDDYDEIDGDESGYRFLIWPNPYFRNLPDFFMSIEMMMKK